ncbi:imidazolonepropionase [Paludicola sp. MB14-C6]|uniref:imidazolonepropionase n=1 Tax=Paludihabitans sp. MB14-C6 TaxID=3070656 RepID=UPI0027DB88A3|nr:imidazolonepropionase [Paludicola sp. MB14-C6]WMJ23959.1 imidazolonepropionase [Paludicola sp. MB14-C6]
MIELGMAHKEIKEYFGLEGDRPIYNLLKSERRKERNLEAKILANPKGRPQKNTLKIHIVTEQEYEIRRLKMENELLRDFLHLAGRK